MSVLKNHLLNKQSSQLFLWLNFTPVALSLFLTLIILVFFKNLPPKLPLFYSLPWGERQLATHLQLLIIPALMSIISLINLIISWQLHQSLEFFKKTLLTASFISCIIFSVTFVKIITIFI